jgi:RHH-type transcriptional regulator, rel operon repressor / antitoxin RelB
MSDTTPVTVQLPVELKERLDELARTTERPASRLAVDAIRSWVEVQEWQLREIHEGLREADAGEFATEDEVSAMWAKWLDAH